MQFLSLHNLQNVLHGLTMVRLGLGFGCHDCGGLSSDTISIMNLNYHSNYNKDVSSAGTVATQSNQRDIIENFILQVKDECITVIRFRQMDLSIVVQQDVEHALPFCIHLQQFV